MSDMSQRSESMHTFIDAQSRLLQSTDLVEIELTLSQMQIIASDSVTSTDTPHACGLEATDQVILTSHITAVRSQAYCKDVFKQRLRRQVRILNAYNGDSSSRPSEDNGLTSVPPAMEPSDIPADKGSVLVQTAMKLFVKAAAHCAFAAQARAWSVNTDGQTYLDAPENMSDLLSRQTPLFPTVSFAGSAQLHSQGSSKPTPLPFPQSAK
ncbi:hypothetical protein GE09DRAFT_1055829 [Coniochaeta sp. 2T2.1]|nr:hypothetical protein GE09DRAFT_1055829 [Coniochaeta sp. 2T2.1]